VVHHRRSKASLRDGACVLPVTQITGFAGHAVEFDCRERKGAGRALHLCGIESTENPAGIGVANGEN
jgi:hypothetical protein